MEHTCVYLKYGHLHLCHPGHSLSQKSRVLHIFGVLSQETKGQQISSSVKENMESMINFVADVNSSLEL